MTTFTTMAELRAARDQKLKDTDFLLVSDLPLTEVDRTAVVTYRQALRDLPANFTEETVSEAVLPPALTANTITKFFG